MTSRTQYQTRLNIAEARIKLDESQVTLFTSKTFQVIFPSTVNSDSLHFISFISLVNEVHHHLYHDIFLLRSALGYHQGKSNEGATQLKRLSSLGLHKTMNPYNAYKQGKLVDLPFLGSIYLETE